jgi:hypothetical protein
MATGTTYGTNFTIAMAAKPSTYLDLAKWGGKVRCIGDTYTSAAQVDSGSYIYVGKLPKGAIPKYAIISTAAGLAGAVTGTIGSLTTAALFGTFTSLNAASTQLLVSSAANTPLTEDTDILIVTAGANFAASKTLDVQLFFACHN